MDIRKPISRAKTAAGNISLPNSPLAGMDKKARKRVRFSAIVFGNLLLLAIIGSFLGINRSANPTVKNSLASGAISTASTATTPLDQLSSAQIALQAAEQTKLPETKAVRSQAQSEILLLSTVPNDSTVLSSPQIVTTAGKSRYQIIFYKVKPGDTVSKIATKHNLTAGSVTGSNNLTGDYVEVGTTLVLPPANGIVYKVKSGDTVNSIVNTYGADKSLFISVNDAEGGIYTGERVWIPNVGVPNAQFNAASSYTSYYGLSNFDPTYGFNGYDYGFCTWYVATRISVPTNWGDANTWDDYARLTPGWRVSTAPRAGAIAQTNGLSYFGHVGYVERVSPDGSRIYLADMNGIAPGSYWGHVGKGWVDASQFQHYIYR